VASFPSAVRLDSAWLSLAEIRIDGGAFIIAALDNEAGTRLDPAPSNFEPEDCGAGAGAGKLAGASRSCVGADFEALERSDGSLFTGVNLRRNVGDVGDETGGPDGDVGTLAAKGDVPDFDWDKDNGDGVYCRGWWIRAVCAAARAPNRLTRELELDAESAVAGRAFVFVFAPRL
jgi:hypothetical protein